MDKKQEIIKWIKEFKRLPTSRIIGLIGVNFEYTHKYLKELETEGKIKKEKETNATYWSLRCRK